LDRRVRQIPGDHVLTVGRLEVFPNAPNVIAGRVEFTVDMRDRHSAGLDRMEAILREEMAHAQPAPGVSFEARVVEDLPAALSSPLVMEAIEFAAASLGLSSLRMQSHAGHDASMLAQIAPMGMIFVPSRDGVSHSPQEFTAPAQCVFGAEVLLRTVLRLEAGKEAGFPVSPTSG
jgi:N-carbamoyl-L-amino-acid hydrolase